MGGLSRRQAVELILLTFLSPLLVGFGLLTPAARDVRAGNEAYARSDYGKALERYRDALTADPSQTVINFDAGDALYKLKRHKEAIEQYQQALAGGRQGDAVTHYNLGNAYCQMGDYAQAVESYKRALALNPNDQWAKFNLELALRKLKGQQQKQQSQQAQQKQSQKQQQQNQSAQQQAEQRPAQSQQKQQQGAQRQQAQEQQGKQTQEGKQTAQAQPMTKEEARRLFQAIMNEDQAAQKRVQRVQAQAYAAPLGKDW